MNVVKVVELQKQYLKVSRQTAYSSFENMMNPLNNKQTMLL